MTLKIDLPDEQTAVRVATAQALGVSPEEYPRQVLEQAIEAAAVETEGQPGKNIEEQFAPSSGLNLDFGRNPSTGRLVEL